MRIKDFVVIIFLLALSYNNFAQSTNDVVSLGEVVVTASKQKRDLCKTPTIQSAALEISASRVDQETMQLNNAVNLVQALDLAPGVFTEHRGRKEKDLSSFRGQIYPYPDYSFNGVWQRSFWEIPSFLPAAAVERLEIMRSGGAIMIGPNAGLVGAVNIVPRRFNEKTVIVDVQGGSFGTVQSSIVGGDNLDKVNYTVGVNYFKTHGPTGENAGEEFSTIFGTIGWMPSDNLNIEATGFALTGKRELRTIQDPGLKKFQTIKESYDPYTSYGSVIKALLTHNSRASTEFDFGYMDRSGRYNKEVKGTVTHTDEDDHEYNAGIIHAHKLTDSNTLRAGLQYNHWVAPNGKRYFTGIKMDIETYSAVIKDEQVFNNLILDAGVRATKKQYNDYTEVTFDLVGDKFIANTIEDEWGDAALTGTFGAKYMFSTGENLYTHIAAGKIDVPPGAVGYNNAPLDSENRYLLDFGIIADSPNGGRLQIGFFGTYRDNAILLTDTKITEGNDIFNTYKNSNIRQYGMELEAQTPFIENILSAYVSATLMNSEIEQDSLWQDYEEIPNFIGTIGINSVINRFDVNLFGKYVSEYKNKRFAEDKQYHDLGEFLNLNMNIGLTLGAEDQARIYLSLENLLNDKYSTVIGYPDYGFRSYIGIQYRL